jgi:hypothetical protein
MPDLTRRGLLVVGGTGLAGAALAGCAPEADPRADASQSALTDAEAAKEASLAAAYRQAATAFPSGEERSTLARFTAAATKRAALAGGEDGGNASPGPGPDGGPDSSEALAGAAHAATAAIAAHREAAGLLDTVEGRALATSSLAACAAELAVVSGFAGSRPAPYAFVTGDSQAPLQSTDLPDSVSSTTTGSSTTTSTAAQ